MGKTAELLLCSGQRLGRNSFWWDTGPPRPGQSWVNHWSTTTGKSQSKCYSFLQDGDNNSASPIPFLPGLNEIRLKRHLEQSWHRVSPQQITIIKGSLSFLTRQTNCHDASYGIFLSHILSRGSLAVGAQREGWDAGGPRAFSYNVGVGSGFATNRWVSLGSSPQTTWTSAL